MTSEGMRVLEGPDEEVTPRGSARLACRGKILFCANTAWSMHQFRRGVLAALIEDGYEVHVAAPEDEDAASLRTMGCIFHALEMSAQGRNPLQDLRLIASLHVLYRKIRPVVIFHYTIKPNIYGSLAARLAGIRSIAITTGLGYVFINTGVVSRVSKMLYRVALRFSREVWFLNQEDRSAFVSEGLVDPGKCRILPGEGVDLDFYALPPDADTPISGNFRFLLIARLLWDKGIGEYVDAARALKARHSQVRCELLGPAGGANPSAIPDSQINAWLAEGVIDYLGTVSDVRPAIAAAHCVVLPSYREGVPRSLMEACAMERPVIATAVPGCRDVIDDGETGFLCRDRDAEDLANKMEAMIKRDPASWRRMGAAGRAKMRTDFDERNVIAHYRRVVQSFA